MLLDILGSISMPMCFPLCSSQTGLVESDDFYKSLLGPGGSSLATRGRICRSAGSSGRTSLAPPAVESTSSASLQVVSLGLATLWLHA